MSHPRERERAKIYFPSALVSQFSLTSFQYPLRKPIFAFIFVSTIKRMVFDKKRKYSAVYIFDLFWLVGVVVVANMQKKRPNVNTLAKWFYSHVVNRRIFLAFFVANKQYWLLLFPPFNFRGPTRFACSFRFVLQMNFTDG